MTKFNKLLLACGLTLATASAEFAETYLRNGDEEINVRVEDGLLFCTRVSDGYEMCNGMAEAGEHTWKGKKMKHPDMPGFMRFNGTVIFYADGLSIEGCALGMCDKEVWYK